jgi:hypothetical protein
MRPGRMILLIVGVLLVASGLGVVAAGTVAGWAHLVHRGDDGFVSSPEFSLASDGYAVTAEHLDLVVTPGEWTPWVDEVDVRLRVTPEQPGDEVFVGLAPRADVETYLADVARDEVTALRTPGGARYAERPGASVPTPPAAETFWTVQSEGTGTQTLAWSVTSGEWAVVVMNADASPGVTVAADAGALTGVLGPLAIGLLLLGLALLGAGAALIVAAVPDEHRPAAPVATPAALPGAAAPSVHPVRLTGHLDPDLGRGLWLVKWLLLLPHLFVLVFLWTAFVVLTVIAGFAILFTGRYPRGIFDLNVGILRWTWRVGFYGYSALGTDRYPPFTLEDVGYPARLDVAYPQHLSRWLVLVKSWLLAFPHLLIVGVLAGGGTGWMFQRNAESGWPVATSGGLIGLLVLVAGVALLFTARYPAGLFDLVVGLNRWVFRVVAYVALMTDEYPPFRLDSGGDEPPTGPPPPPAPRSGDAPDRALTPTG